MAVTQQTPQSLRKEEQNEQHPERTANILDGNLKDCITVQCVSKHSEGLLCKLLTEMFRYFQVFDRGTLAFSLSV